MVIDGRFDAGAALKNGFGRKLLAEKAIFPVCIKPKFIIMGIHHIFSEEDFVFAPTLAGCWFPLNK